LLVWVAVMFKLLVKAGFNVYLELNTSGPVLLTGSYS